MKALIRILRLGMLILFVAIGGCSEIYAPQDLVTVTGEVLSIEDLVPIDGGVTIDLSLSDGETEKLFFESLFTYPPPSQERLDLYQVIRDVDIGDQVRAAGIRNDNGLVLEEIEVLQ